MNKNSIKKLIVSIVFIVILVMFFLVWKNINDNKEVKRITIVKNVVKEKYDKVYFNDDSDYLYTLNKDDGYLYRVFDLHGNRLYSIKSDKELDIKKVMKKYYITYDKSYHLFNSENEEINSGDVIEGINETLIRIDNKIINYNNEILFKDIKTINTFLSDRYINIDDKYLIDKKGKVLLSNTSVVDEMNNNNISEYLIIKQGDKYYTFFTKADKVLGDGFNNYTKDKDLIIKVGNSIYKIYITGLRKKISTIPTKLENDYIFDDRVLLIDKSFVINKKNNSFGLLDFNKKEFTKITKESVNDIEKIDKNNYLIHTDSNNYVFNINNKQIVLKTDKRFDYINIFDNNYKSLRSDGEYTLYDSYNNMIKKSDKQIVLNEKIKVGEVYDNFYLFNLSDRTTNELNKLKINNKTYYFFDNVLYDDSFNKVIKSSFITSTNSSVIYLDNNRIVFDNKKDNKISYYKLLENEEIVNDSTLGNIIIIEGNNYIKILNDKGDLIKKIKNRKVLNYYITKKDQVLIITGLQDNNRLYEGSYLAE